MNKEKFVKANMVAVNLVAALEARDIKLGKSETFADSAAVVDAMEAKNKNAKAIDMVAAREAEKQAA